MTLTTTGLGIRRLRTPLALTIGGVAVAWALAGALPGAASTDIKTAWDKKFSFAGLSTWAWHPEGPGDVKLGLTAESDPKAVAARVDPVIIPAIERELGSKKFTKTTTGQPDLYVHYYLLVTVGQSAQIQGQFLPSTVEWGLPPFAPMTTALSIYPVGTLVLDILSAKREIVWRGAAQRKVDIERPDEERRKVLERAIADLLKKFPPQGK